MPRGNRPSTAALTRSGARKASEMVMLTWRTLHFCNLASSPMDRRCDPRSSNPRGCQRSAQKRQPDSHTINLHQLSDPFLTWNFQIAAASTTCAMAGACREPIRTGRTVAGSPCGTRRNCWCAQGSAWCLHVAAGTGRRPLIVRHRSEIGKAATARTIILIFRHSQFSRSALERRIRKWSAGGNRARPADTFSLATCA